MVVNGGSIILNRFVCVPWTSTANSIIMNSFVSFTEHRLRLSHRDQLHTIHWLSTANLMYTTSKLEEKKFRSSMHIHHTLVSDAEAPMS